MKNMKTLFFPVVIIVGLVVVFVIADRKDFMRGNDAQSAATTAGTTASVFEERTAPPQKNGHAKKTNDTGFKSENGSNGLDKMDRIESDAGMEVAVEGKNGNPPFAIPVLTMEEAEEANNYALFLSDLKNEKKIALVEGTIEDRSELPDLQTVDYPDCRFTAHFIGHSIQSGASCPKEVSLVIEGISNYILLENASIKKGDKVLCSIIPYDLLPEDYQSIQQADDLHLFLFETYYAIDICPVDSFIDNGITEISGIPFSDNDEDYISIFDRRINDPIPQSARKAQDTVIEKDRKKMESLLESYDGERIKKVNAQFVEAWTENKRKDPPGYNRVRDGKIVWRKIDDSFWCLSEKYVLLSPPQELSSSILDCFHALKKSLEANGVQLIVSLVPNSYAISSRVINKDFIDIPDLQTATYVKQLSEIGIETIYASDSILKAYNKYPFAFFYPDNAHPHDTAQQVISDILVERLKRYNITPNLDSALFSKIQSTNHFMASHEDLFSWPENCDISPNKPGDSFSCEQIFYNGKTIERDESSPIIIFGNSYCVSPMRMGRQPYCDSLPSLVSLKTLSSIDWHRFPYLGVLQESLYQLLSNPEYFLKGKKVAIFVLGVNHLSAVDKQKLMGNIHQIDRDRRLFNKKRKVVSLKPLASNGSLAPTDEVWDSIPDKTEYRINNSNGTIAIDIPGIDYEKSGIDSSKETLLVFRAISYYHTSCVLCVNGQEQLIPSYEEKPLFYLIPFKVQINSESPIHIEVRGNNGTLFAIRDIEFWQ